MSAPKALYPLSVSSPNAFSVIKRVEMTAFLPVGKKMELRDEEMDIGSRQLQKIAVGEAINEVLGVLTSNVI